MKANHNTLYISEPKKRTVSYGSKILKWKQITTFLYWICKDLDCFLWFKDTKMKANHNNASLVQQIMVTVSYGSKILKWKQITTFSNLLKVLENCFLWFKDTKMKANHNFTEYLLFNVITVSYGSKILKWKQITTLKSVLIYTW